MKGACGNSPENHQDRTLPHPPPRRQETQILWTENLVHVSIWRLKNHRNCLQQGRSNLVDEVEWPKIGLLNPNCGSILSEFPPGPATSEIISRNPWVIKFHGRLGC